MALLSVPLLAHEWVKVGVTANELEQRIGQLAHQPPVRVRDGADGARFCANDGDAVSEVVHKGVICLFRGLTVRHGRMLAVCCWGKCASRSTTAPASPTTVNVQPRFEPPGQPVQALTQVPQRQLRAACMFVQQPQVSSLVHPLGTAPNIV
jgi:hypothetical protein